MNKKVGIVTYYEIYNYGSFLQAFAMQKTLESMGYCVSILKFDESQFLYKIKMKFAIVFKLLIWPQYIKSVLALRRMGKNSKADLSSKTIKMFKNSIQKELNIEKDTFEGFKRRGKTNEFIAFICGSDQIWSPLGIYLRKHKFLEFAPKNKRIAYAPSFGINYIPKYNAIKIKRNLGNIKCLSIRETAGKDIIKKLVGLEAEVVLDPTLMVRDEFWKKLIKKSDNTKKDYVVCYFLSTPKENVYDEIIKYANNLELEIIYFPYEKFFENCDSAKFIELDPFNFLETLANSKIVFTDSFHGTAFSVIFEKPFITFSRNHLNEYNQEARITSFLDSVKLIQRYKKNVIESGLNSELMKCDFSEAKKLLNEQRIKSIKFLNESLAKMEIYNE